MDISALYQIYLQHPTISTDSRAISEGCIFFALKGERFNGNKYAPQSIEKGAAYAVIDEAVYAVNERCILVDNVLETLQQLANYHRRQLTIPVIGITGSNGKTTTKELVSNVLATTYKTAFTAGNFNNHIGVPLTLLRIPSDTEIAVIEMGANHQREIAFLCEIAEPTHGIITNIGKAHLEGFGGVEGVKKGKSELYEYLAKHKGIAFINTEQAFLRDLAEERKVRKIYKYGQDGRLKYAAKLLTDHPSINVVFKVGGEKFNIESPLFGAYNFYNINTAIAVGRYFEVTPKKIKAAIEAYSPTNNRSQIVTFGSNQVILDAYNANPTSTKNAVSLFAKLKANKKVVILGDMLELGTESQIEHQAMANFVAQQHFDTTIFVGKEYSQVNLSDGLHFDTVVDLKKWYANNIIDHAHFLIKGSRGIRLERLLNE